MKKEKEDKTPDVIAPTLADLKIWLDHAISPGQSFNSDQACRGVGAHNREHKKRVYMSLSRCVKDELIKKDPYRHGCFIRFLEIGPYDLGGDIKVNKLMGIQAPLDIHNILTFLANQLISIAGRYDAGKSAFLWHLLYLALGAVRVQKTI